jgi:hypothetical protein
MLNRPARKPRATDSPTKMSGVAVTIVSEMGYSAAWIWSSSPDTIALPISVGSRTRR